MKRFLLLITALASCTLVNHGQTVTDIDGNVYNTVTIGTQTWMQENLKVIHYNNGDSIPCTTTSTINGAYCNYDNDTNNVKTFGRLYNWYAIVDNRNIAPVGWHIPSDSEWQILVNYLGGDSIAGGKMKEPDTILWDSPNLGATNESGFTGLPGGFNDNCAFYLNGEDGWWLSSTEDNAQNAWYEDLWYNYTGILRTNGLNTYLLSVRCVKDSLVSIKEFNNENHIEIYPNLAINKAYIECNESRNFKMQLYNVTGECILQKELSGCKNEIDISSLSKGIYVVKLTGANWTVQRKLIKE